jgi:hypothetical protein
MRAGSGRQSVVSSLARGSGPTGTSSRAEIIDLAAGRTPLPLPVEAYFEVANRCNSLCATCPLTLSPQEAARQLSLVEFKTLVAQLPDLRRAVLKGRGVYTLFNTNAALLTYRRQVELIEGGLDELRVSLDSSTPETYVKIRAFPCSTASSPISAKWSVRDGGWPRCRRASPSG